MHKMRMFICISVEEKVKFKEPLKNVEVLQGDRAVFRCEVTKPGSPVKWLRNGKPIKPSDKYEIIEEGTVHTLIIKDATMEDMDEFAATVGDDKTTGRLIVEGIVRLMCSSKILSITHNLKTFSFQVNNSISNNCIISIPKRFCSVYPIIAHA